MKSLGHAVILLSAAVHACTLIGVGHKATLDGSTMVAHSNDGVSKPTDLRLVRVPSMNHSSGSQRAVYNYLTRHGYPRFVSNERGPGYMPRNGSNQTATVPLGYIPQVAKTYAYWDHDFGMQNEVQLSIGETTCSAKTVGYPLDLSYGKNLLDIDELTSIALERCDSAICAVKTMGSLAEEYGFYGEYSDDPSIPSYGASAEGLIISDKYDQVWVFHILTGPHNSGAVWAAQRLPDEHFIIVPNTFVIRGMNLTDSDNFLASSNVHSFAYEQGWASPEKPFDFTSAYGWAANSITKPLYGGRRMWRAYDMVAPSQQFNPELGFHARVPTYPFSVKPDLKLSPKSIFRILGDYYQGTAYDLTKGMAAGPFHDPSRYSNVRNTTGNWERSISLHRMTHSFVLQSRSFLPDGVGGIAWYGPGIAADTVYFPISCGQKELPRVFNLALRTKFDLESTWWAFHFTSNWAHLRYDLIHHDINKQRYAFTEAGMALQAATEAKCKELQYSAECTELIQNNYNQFIENTTTAWWSFAWHLVSTYNDGYKFFNESSTGGQTIAYPASWGNHTNYILYPQKYNPPSEVRLEENMTVAVDPDTGVTSTVETTFDLPSGFLLGFGCGFGSLVIVLFTMKATQHHRQTRAKSEEPVDKNSPKADKTVVSEASTANVV